jgi:hypothetical protein
MNAALSNEPAHLPHAVWGLKAKWCALVVPLLVAALPLLGASPSAPGVTASPIISSTTACSSAVRVALTDLASGYPIAFAHVTLASSTLSYDGFTDRNGSVSFGGVACQRYDVRVSRSDYRFREPIVVVRVVPQVIRITGVRTAPRQIGAVQSSASPPTTGSATNGSSLPGATEGSALGALERSASLSSLPNGGLSIDGRSPYETSIGLNGGAVLPPGIGPLTNFVSGDLFDSASINVRSSPGSPSGSLGLRTFDPTLDWIGLGEQRLTGSDLTSNLLERGTSGRIGLSLLAELARTAGPYDGQTFYDASGLDYAHDARTTNDGVALTSRYPFDANDVSFFDFIDTGRRGGLPCSTLTGPIPCSNGVGSSVTDGLSIMQLRDNITTRNWTFELHAFRSDVTSDETLVPSSLLESIAPASGSTMSRLDARRTGEQLRATYGSPSGSLFTVDELVANDQTIAPAAGSRLAQSLLASTGTSSVELADQPHVASRWSPEYRAGFTSAGQFHSLSFGSGLTSRLTDHDRLKLEYQAGLLSQPFGSGLGLADPSQLDYDCAGRRALGFGPILASSQAPIAQRGDVTWTHDEDRWHSSLRLYRDLDTPGLVTGAIVPGSSLPGYLFSQAYLAAASTNIGRLCGGARPLAPNDLSYTTIGYAGRVLRSGLDANFELSVTRSTKLGVNYSITDAQSAGLFGPLPQAFNLAPNAQLPQIPLHTASIDALTQLRGGIQSYVSLRYVGADNSFTRSPFAGVDLGVRLSIPDGDAVFAVTNLTDAASPRFGAFEPFPYLAQPFGPRTVGLRLRFAIGRTIVDRVIVQNPVSGVVAFTPRPFDQGNAAAALTVDKSAVVCGPEDVVAAQRILDEIGAFAGEIESGLRPATRKEPDGVLLTPLPAGTKTILKVTLPPDRRILKPFFGCARLYAGDVGQAEQLDLFVPSLEEQREASGRALYFAPGLGLYFSPDAVNGTSLPDTFNMHFPDHRPLAKIALDAAHCPATMIDAAGQALDELKGYFSAADAGKTPTDSPDGFAITEHRTKSQPWFEIQSTSAELNYAIAQCAGIPIATKAGLRIYGISGGGSPSINYSKPVGFYTVALPAAH